MKLITQFNTIDIKEKCLKCEKTNIKKPNMSRAGFDWICLDCGNKQLNYIKSKGFRYYAFLLSGSWTSEYIFARSVKEAYRFALKMYKDKHEVYKTYMTGSADCFVLSYWKHFE